MKVIMEIKLELIIVIILIINIQYNQYNVQINVWKIKDIRLLKIENVFQNALNQIH